MPLYSLKVQTLIVRWKHFHSSSSAVFMDDAVLQWVLYCVCVWTQEERWGWEILEHPTYSPDLAPSDFHLFPNLKKTSSCQAIQITWWCQASGANMAAWSGSHLL